MKQKQLSEVCGWNMANWCHFLSESDLHNFTEQITTDVEV